MSDTVDYAALAAQAGAVSSTPPPAPGGGRGGVGVNPPAPVAGGGRGSPTVTPAPSAGGVDYTALAKQAGATSSTPAPATGPNASPGASDEEMIRSFGYDPNLVKGSPRYQADVKTYGSLSKMLHADPSGFYGSASNTPGVAQLSDVSHGAMMPLIGAGQLVRHAFNKVGIISDADLAYGDFLDRLSHQDYQQNVRHGNASHALEVLGSIMFPMPGGGASKGLTGAVLSGAARGGAAGGMQPVLSGPPEDFASQKTGQVAGGAMLGAGLGAVGHVVGGGGRAPLPETQAGATVQKLRAGMEETPWGDLTDVENIAKTGGERSGEAQAVLDQVKAAETPRQTMQADESLQSFRAKQVSDQLYANVDQISQEYGVGRPTATATMGAVTRAETEAQSGLKDSGLNSTLAQVRKIITPEAPPAPAASGLVDASGHPLPAAPPPAAPPPGASYAELRKLSSQIDEIIRDKRTAGNELVGDRSIPLLRSVQNGINQDLAKYAQNSKVPELQAAAQQADNFYRDNVVPFKDANVSQTATADETDAIYKRFIRQDSPDRAVKFYAALGSKGQAAVQYQMVLDAWKKGLGTVDAAGKPLTTFNSAAFTQRMQQLQDAYGVFFQGQDKAAINGMRNFVAQAARVDANPASAFGNVKGAAVSAIPRSSEVLKFMMTQPQGRRFLYTLSGMKPGNGITAAVFNRAETAAGRWVASRQQSPTAAGPE